MRSHRLRAQLVGLAAMVVVTLLAGCSTDRQTLHREEPEARSEESPPRYESRTGVPVLMDLPLIGWMFRRTTTVR